MSFFITWRPKPYTYLKKLPDAISKRIWDKVGAIKTNPFRYLEHHEGNSLFKLRIGDYRILVEVLFEKKILVIQVLDKRGRVYKR